MKYQSNKKVQRFEVKYSTCSKKQGYSYIYFISYSNQEKTDKRCMKVKCAVRIRFAIAFRDRLMKGTDRHSDAGRGNGGPLLGPLAYGERAPVKRDISQILTRGYWPR